MKQNRMLKCLTVNVSDHFDMQQFALEVTNRYYARRYYVHTFDSPSGLTIVLVRRSGNVGSRLGMGVGIEATCALENGQLHVRYTDHERGKRIECLIFGWFLLLVPVVTALIGFSRQRDVERRFAHEVRKIAEKM